MSTLHDSTKDEVSRRIERLERELTRISARANANVGATFHHLETGVELSLNGDLLFPMASTLKVPVAVHALALVDEGELNLKQVITLKSSDIYAPTWGPICTFLRAGSVMTLLDLIAVMLIDSDNNATDIALRLVGGTAAVKERMRSYGLKRISNDRPICVHLVNLFGKEEITEATGISTEEYRRVVPDTDSGDWGAWAGEKAQAKLRRAENAEVRDTTTPSDMAALLVKVWSGQILRPASRQLLLDILYRCITGPGRLKGMLPPGNRVAHKTGTLFFATNDVGIIDLPESAGHLVAAIFTKDSHETLAAKRDVVIAQLARAAHDYFTFMSGS